MPYIKQEDRGRATPVLADIRTAGELNFAISVLLQEYVERHGLCYETLNAAVGAISGAKAEFQRRVVGPYEDLKISENGDVYYFEELQ